MRRPFASPPEVLPAAAGSSVLCPHPEELSPRPADSTADPEAGAHCFPPAPSRLCVPERMCPRSDWWRCGVSQAHIT